MTTTITTTPADTEPARRTRSEETLERLTTGIIDLTTSQAWTAWRRV
jgi:hypothetical protein